VIDYLRYYLYKLFLLSIFSPRTPSACAVLPIAAHVATFVLLIVAHAAVFVLPAFTPLILVAALSAISAPPTAFSAVLITIFVSPIFSLQAKVTTAICCMQCIPTLCARVADWQPHRLQTW